MIAIAVDDEQLMLHALVRAISASPDIKEVVKFSNCEKALDYVKENTIDVAFLDINMRGMGGIALAEKIIKLRPNSKIVFCTGYEEYAIPAFKLHASGYLMKPISAEDVQNEIDNIKGVRKKEKLLEVKCFGNFEVYVNGEKVNDEVIKETSYELVDLPYNMNGNEVRVTAFYDEGESAKSEAVYVYVSGMSAVSGNFFEQDGVTPVVGGIVTLNGTDELGNPQSYTIVADETGAYAGDVLAGSYIAVASVEEYQNVFSAIFIDIPAGCCSQLSVKNTSGATIEVQNANLIVERVA